MARFKKLKRPVNVKTAATLARRARGHVNVRRRLQAGWARHVHRLMSPRPAAWKNVWWFELRQIYGSLVDYDLPLTTCTYQLVNTSAGPSQIQKLALKAWACLRLAPATLVKPELSQAGQSRHALAAGCHLRTNDRVCPRARVTDGRRAATW